MFSYPLVYCLYVYSNDGIFQIFFLKLQIFKLMIMVCLHPIPQHAHTNDDRARMIVGTVCHNAHTHINNQLNVRRAYVCSSHPCICMIGHIDHIQNLNFGINERIYYVMFHLINPNRFEYFRICIRFVVCALRKCDREDFVVKNFLSQTEQPCMRSASVLVCISEEKL